MRINITGIRKLTDGTVTGSFTTDKDNYLPLVILDNDGKPIHLTTEQKEESVPAFLLVMRDMIQRELRNEYERGLADAVQGNLLTEKGENDEYRIGSIRATGHSSIKTA